MERCGKSMDCKEVEKKIPSFLQEELGGSSLEEFMGHIQHSAFGHRRFGTPGAGQQFQPTRRTSD